MKKKNIKKSNSNYIEDMKEVWRNQYNPGHFLGGRLHPFLLKPKKPLILGILYILGGIFCIFIFVYPTITMYFSLYNIPAMIMGFILTCGVGAIYILAGVNYLKKAKMNKMNLEKTNIKKRKRKRKR